MSLVFGSASKQSFLLVPAGCFRSARPAVQFSVGPGAWPWPTW